MKKAMMRVILVAMNGDKNAGESWRMKLRIEMQVELLKKWNGPLKSLIKFWAQVITNG